MNAEFDIVPLAHSHHRLLFDSGVDVLNRYLLTQVTQDVRRRLTNCFVAVDEAACVVGYYTLSATSLPIHELADDESRKIPRYPLLPAGLIGRLAVDRRFQRQGLGSCLLVNAIARAGRADVAIYTMIVDAKNDAAVAFYRHHGFRPLLSRPMSLYIPIKGLIHSFVDSQ